MAAFGNYQPSTPPSWLPLGWNVSNLSPKGAVPINTWELPSGITKTIVNNPSAPLGRSYSIQGVDKLSNEVLLSSWGKAASSGPYNPMTGTNVGPVPGQVAFEVAARQELIRRGYGPYLQDMANKANSTDWGAIAGMGILSGGAMGLFGGAGGGGASAGGAGAYTPTAGQGLAGGTAGASAGAGGTAGTAVGAGAGGTGAGMGMSAAAGAPAYAGQIGAAQALPNYFGSAYAGTGAAASGGGFGDFLNTVFGTGGKTAGAAGGFPTRELLSSGLSGLLGYSQMQSAKDAANRAAALSDPFASQRPQYQQQLSSLMANPSSISSLPGYQFRMDQGQQALERSLAAGGYLKSGNLLQDVSKFGQDYASNEYDKEVNRLSGLAGANVSPSGAGSNYLNGMTGYTTGQNMMAGGLSTAGRLLYDEMTKNNQPMFSGYTNNNNIAPLV